MQTQHKRPLIFQAFYSVKSNNVSWNSKGLSCVKDEEIRQFVFGGKNSVSYKTIKNGDVQCNNS